jgi:hypothetical protein
MANRLAPLFDGTVLARKSEAPARRKTKLVAVLPDGTERVLHKVNGVVHLDDGTSARTIRSAREHFEARGARIERRAR